MNALKRIVEQETKELQLEIDERILKMCEFVKRTLQDPSERNMVVGELHDSISNINKLIDAKTKRIIEAIQLYCEDDSEDDEL